MLVAFIVVLALALICAAVAVWAGIKFYVAGAVGAYLLAVALVALAFVIIALSPWGLR